MYYLRATIRGDILLSENDSNNTNSAIPAKILGKILIDLQRSVDRAHILITRGRVGKNDRMRSVAGDYAESQFYISVIEQNCISFNLTGLRRYLDKLVECIDSPYNQATQNFIDENSRLQNEASAVVIQNADAIPYNEYLNVAQGDVERSFAQRSIAKYIDSATNFVRSPSFGTNSINLSIVTDQTRDYIFDSRISANFGKIVNSRRLSRKIVIECNVVDFLETVHKARVQIVGSNNLRMLYFKDTEQMYQLYPHDARVIRKIECSPIFEFGSYDFEKGDFYFIDVVD